MMETARIHVRGTSKPVLSGLAACLLLTACGGGGGVEEQRVRAAQQCDDTLSPDAARALGTVLKRENFDHGPKGGLERSAGELIADHDDRERTTMHRPLCRVSVPGSLDRIDIDFGLYDIDEPFGDVHPHGLHYYDMGREAQSGPKRAYLFVACVSPRLKGSDKNPARIRGELNFTHSELPDTVAVREANLTVLHSVTLAVVKKLGCENNAGLTDKPVFKPG
ncbi:hypothetical protein [Streptomyces sp. NPDC101115]|uniref:hypothetical protein n=1 Tax=Streptomyces sp. NPDC101115 TaxID=3366106 RepID=UPI0037FE3BB8